MSNKKSQKKIQRKIIRKPEETSKITTMKVLEETKLRLERLREHKRESYDDILRKILYVLNISREDPEKARRTLERISDNHKVMLGEEEEQKENLERESRN
jgi:hypothetical protein|tara:strand:- start:502 stop:804 length:303 start_codon:yes stop_codon:yes gene_type:complete